MKTKLHSLLSWFFLCYCFDSFTARFSAKMNRQTDISHSNAFNVYYNKTSLSLLLPLPLSSDFYYFA